MKLVSAVVALVVVLVPGCRTADRVHAEPVATVADTRTTAEVFDAIVERSKHVDSFDATFVATKADASQASRLHVRFAREQGLAISVGDEREGFVTVYRDGALAMRIRPSENESMSADIDGTAVVREMVDVAADLVTGSFPELAFETRPIRPFVRFSYAKDAGPRGGLDLQIGVGYGAPSPPYGWLSWLRTKLDACERRGDALVFTLGDGAEAEVAIATGFLTAIRTSDEGAQRASLTLESLRTPATFDASAFDLPPRIDGARDLSAESRALLADVIVRDLDQRLCGRFERLVAGGKLAGDAADVAKLSHVLASLHRKTMGERLAPLRDETRTGIEQLGAWVTVQLDAASDAEAMVALAVEKWREKLVARVDAWAKGLDGRFGLPYPPRANPELHAELARVVRDAEHAAFRDELREPLLAELDAHMKQALAR